MRTPYDTFIALQLLWGQNEREIIKGILELELPFWVPRSIQKPGLSENMQAQVTLAAFIRRVKKTLPTVQVPSLGDIPEEALEWADGRFLDLGLLRPFNRRFEGAKSVCFYPDLRHIIQVCLLDRNLDWKDVVRTVEEYGQIEGLTQELVWDYQQIFWYFDGLSPRERSSFLHLTNISSGTMLANKGQSQMGLAIDLGVPIEMSNLDRYRYMRDLSFIKYVRDMQADNMKPRDAGTLVEIVLALDERIKNLEDEELARIGTGIETEFTIEEENLLSVDELTQEELNEPERKAAVVPFPR